MTREDIVGELARERVVETIIVRMTKRDWCADFADLAQMVYLVLLEYPEDKVQEMYDDGWVRFFIARVIRNQYYSRNSPFYALFRRKQRDTFALSAIDADTLDEAEVERLAALKKQPQR